ncbi:MAG: GNAT family N-acetyltransferase [Bradyrhizobiaceae bacterium]|nr:MAG: GNAT family N-acetyltransferase [Bradyrhizobiaceae bacterium]
MTAADLPAVCALSASIHQAYPEDDAVFAERLRLYPDGCHVYASADKIAAYVLSHPWRAFDAPPLNSLLGAIPAAPSTYYIHDLALAPQTRGTGTATWIVSKLAEHAFATRLSAMSLVAVNGSAGFWQRQGFVRADVPALAEKLRTYRDDGARFMTRTL